MRSSIFHHGHAADSRDDDKATVAPERRAPRSLLASPWFWIGGLVSVAIWAGIYAAFVR